MSEIEGPWVELGQFADPLDVQPLRIRLEGEGIPTMIDGGRMGSRSMYQVATGGVTLLVPEPLLADARILQDQTWSKDAAELGVEDDDDWDDAPEDHDELGFHGAGESAWRRMAVTTAVILIVVPTAWNFAQILTFLGRWLGR